MSAFVEMKYETQICAIIGDLAFESCWDILFLQIQVSSRDRNTPSSARRNGLTARARKIFPTNSSAVYSFSKESRNLSKFSVVRYKPFNRCCVSPALRIQSCFSTNYVPRRGVSVNTRPPTTAGYWPKRLNPPGTCDFSEDVDKSPRAFSTSEFVWEQVGLYATSWVASLAFIQDEKTKLCELTYIQRY